MSVVLLGGVSCSWANREEVWKIMLNKEKTYFRDKHLLQRHPLLQPRMRAILLDWLMEVSWPRLAPAGPAPPRALARLRLRGCGHALLWSDFLLSPCVFP